MIPYCRAFSRDPEVFPDPESFRPERFLDETETKEKLPSFTHNEVKALPLRYHDHV